MQLSEVVVDIVLPEEERRFRALLDRHHYLGAAPKIGETIWYVARGRRRWLALLAFSSAALKCRARDAWIGWDYPQQYNRLHLLTNNVRYLILPGRHPAHLGSRVLGLCARRLGRDWQARFGHPLLLLETFVDPARFRGTVYRAANWQLVGKTRGFRRDGGGYREGSTPKQVFLRPLARDARQQLSRARLDPALQHGVRTAMITAEQMRSLPAFFGEIDDPRTRRGRRHTLSSVLALATAATLCGMRGYKAMSEWVNDLSPQVLIRFRVRRRGGVPQRPSRSTLRDVLTRVDPAQLDQALRRWHEAHGGEDAALSIDGKTLRGAIAADGSQAHVMSVVGHDSKATYAQKKVGLKPGADDETRRTNEIGTVIPLLDMLPDIAAKTFTADAMLTQRKLAEYLRDRRAHFVFTVKENQPTLYGDILLHFDTGAARGAGLRGESQPGARPHRAARHLDDFRVERLPLLPSRRPSLHDPPPPHRQENRQGQHRDRLRHHQPCAGFRQRGADPALEPQPLVYRKRSSFLPRLELGRRSQPHPHRLWPGKHHPPAALRHRPHQGPRPRGRAHPAAAEPQYPRRPRLPQVDPQQPADPRTGRRARHLIQPARQAGRRRSRPRREPFAMAERRTLPENPPPGAVRKRPGTRNFRSRHRNSPGQTPENQIRTGNPRHNLRTVLPCAFPGNAFHSCSDSIPRGSFPGSGYRLGEQGLFSCSFQLGGWSEERSASLRSWSVIQHHKRGKRSRGARIS